MGYLCKVARLNVGYPLTITRTTGINVAAILSSFPFQPLLGSVTHSGDSVHRHNYRCQGRRFSQSKKINHPASLEEPSTTSLRFQFTQRISWAQTTAGVSLATQAGVAMRHGPLKQRGMTARAARHHSTRHCLPPCGVSERSYSPSFDLQYNPTSRSLGVFSIHGPFAFEGKGHGGPQQMPKLTREAAGELSVPEDYQFTQTPGSFFSAENIAALKGSFHSGCHGVRKRKQEKNGEEEEEGREVKS